MTQTNRSNARLGLWAVLIAVTALGVPTSAQSRWDGSGVTVYADPNFSGQSASFRDDTPNMLPYNLNDKISSIQIPTGETWEVCQDIDYGNQCHVLTGSVSDLRDLGWNDRISSLRRITNGGFRDGGSRDRRSGGVFAPEGGGRDVAVFVNPNFGGQSASFRDDTPNMVPYNLNDKISSIRIPAGDTWEVCQDADYGNQCQVLSGSVADLRSIGWNDRISSLRRITNGGFRDGGFRERRSGGVFGPEGGGRDVTVFVNPNFGGQSATFRDDTPNMVPFNLNDKISSIRIPTGDTWEVCQDADYGNQCQVLSGNVADLRSIGWNDRISSLRRTNDNNGRFRDRRSGGGNVEGVGQGLVFYAQNGYRGASMLVTTASSNTGFPARQGSVQLRGGGAWEVCDGSGRCATIDQDVSNVSQLGLNGRITSVRPVTSSAWDRRNRGIGRNR